MMRRQQARRRAPRALVLLASLLTLAALPGPPPAAAAGLGVAGDGWSAPMEMLLPDGFHMAPIHASLMPDGRVVLIGQEHSDAQMLATTVNRRGVSVLTPGPAAVTAAVTPVVPPMDAVEFPYGDWRVNDDLVCSGHTLMADGTLFTAGGTRTWSDGVTGQESVLGLQYATTFDGTTWRRVGADMVAVGSTGSTGRWYPTVTRLPDGRMLVTSGYDEVLPEGRGNLSTEIYSPGASSGSGTWQVASPMGATPFEILNSNYTHTFVLPTPVKGGDILMLGEPGVPALTSVASGSTWTVSAAYRPGSAAFQQQRLTTGGLWNPASAPDNGAASTLLPFRANNGDLGYANGSVLVAGGANATSWEQSADVYDPVADAWRPTLNLGVSRHDPSTVLLPDGRILVVGGESSDPNVTRAEYIDPANGFSVSLGSSDGREVRGYHSVALLLPDGSVLVGGGRDVNSATSAEKSSFRYLYPSYLFGPRPSIVSAPSQINLGMPFSVQTGGSVPAQVVLMGLGSMTHSFDMDQRSIQLSMGLVLPTAGGGGLAVVNGPASAQVAPPGDYMLFVLDANRVPSVARIVHLG